VEIESPAHEVVFAMVGTAGHVDHGKTELVKLLTGCDTDRLRAEKERGLSIELGFAPCRLSDQRRIVGIVDVPGHSDFIRNMVAGASSVDVLMLVIAGDDGVMPQTDEHMRILKLMRVPRVMVVITKVDLLDPELEQLVREEVAGFMSKMGYPNAPIVLMSNRTKRGLDQVQRTLEQLVDDEIREASARPRDDRAFRMNVERVFASKGHGTVAVGVPTSGRVGLHDHLEVLPGNTHTSARAFQTYGFEADDARAGACLAVNLRGVDAEDVSRGMTLAKPGVYHPTNAFVATLENLGKGPPIRRRTNVRLHVGTSVATVSAALIGTDELTFGDDGFVHLKLPDSLVVSTGDRFVLRQLSPPATIGGGAVLSPLVSRLKRKSPHVLQALERARDALDEGDLFGAALAASMLDVVRYDQLMQLSASTGNEADRLVADKVRDGELLDFGDAWIVHAELPTLAVRLQRTLETYHRQNRGAWGMAPTQVCRLIGIQPRLFTQLATALCDSCDDLVLRHGFLALRGQLPALSPDALRAKDAIARCVASEGVNAPARGDLAASLGLTKREMDPLVRALTAEGVIRPFGVYLMSARAIARCVELLLTLFENNPEVGLNEFREVTGASRRVAVAMLEALDAKGVTRRAGSGRVLIRPPDAEW
jgi:selenocysteine-specific elongation factor